MTSNNFLLYSTLLYCLFSNTCKADDGLVEYTLQIGPSPSSVLTLESQAADSTDYGFGKSYDVQAMEYFRVCNSKKVNYTLTRVDVLPTAPFIENIKTPAVIGLYNTASKGWNLSALVTIYGGGIIYYLTGSEATTIYKGRLDNKTRLAQDGLQFTGREYIMRGADRQEPDENNQVLIPSQPFYDILCIDDQETVRERVKAIMNPVQIKFDNFRTCTPDSNIAFIDLKTAPISKFADSKSLVNTVSSNFSLTCDENIAVFYSINDQSDLSNISDTATLTSDSSAKGIGVAVVGPTSPSARGRLKFGPDGSSQGIPNQTQYPLQRGYTTKGQRVSMTLDFSYIKSGNAPVEAGTANALIGITYSYH